GSTLADIPLLLMDRSFRRWCIEGVSGLSDLKSFWQWYDGLSAAEQSRVTGPVMSRLRAVLLRDFVRKSLGPANPPLDIGAVLNGGALLVRVPKGVLGSDASRLLGSFVMARVWQEVTGRARDRIRHDASLYVDECQNFMTLPRSIEEMLAEARGY